MEHHRIVLEVLRRNQLFAKLSKCGFWLDRVAFLGHVLSEGGVSVDPEKVSKVQGWHVPRSVSEVRSFMGLAGYYCQFIQDFSKIVNTITRLMAKDVPYIWSKACQHALDELKLKLTSAPVLVLPDRTGDYEVFCDALGMGVGCVLHQRGKVVAYASR